MPTSRVCMGSATARESSGQGLQRPARDSSGHSVLLLDAYKVCMPNKRKKWKNPESHHISLLSGTITEWHGIGGAGSLEYISFSFSFIILNPTIFWYISFSFSFIIHKLEFRFQTYWVEQLMSGTDKDQHCLTILDSYYLCLDLNSSLFSLF
jgi:hypothetical protein